MFPVNQKVGGILTVFARDEVIVLGCVIPIEGRMVSDVHSTVYSVMVLKSLRCERSVFPEAITSVLINVFEVHFVKFSCRE